MRYTQITVLLVLTIRTVFSTPFDLQTARNIKPEKSPDEIKEVVDFLRKHPQATLIEFKTPVEYMTKLRQINKKYPNAESEKFRKPLVRSTKETLSINSINQRNSLQNDPIPKQSIELVVHNYKDDYIVKKELPRIYNVVMRSVVEKACPDCGGCGSKDKFVNKTRMVKCPKCSGTGKKPRPLRSYSSRRSVRIETVMAVCEECKGNGEVASTHQATTQTPCSTCQGTGKVEALGVQEHILVFNPTYGQTASGGVASK